MTVHLDFFSFIDHFLNVFFPNTDQGSFHSLFAAGTVELGRDPIVKFNVKSLQVLRELFR